MTQEDDEAFGILGLHGIRLTVTPQKVDYQEILGTDTLNDVHSKYAWYFKLFNYALSPVVGSNKPIAAPALPSNPL